MDKRNVRRAVFLVLGLYVAALGLLPLSKSAANFVFAVALLCAAGVAGAGILGASVRGMSEGIKRRIARGHTAGGPGGRPQ